MFPRVANLSWIRSDVSMPRKPEVVQVCCLYAKHIAMLQVRCFQAEQTRVVTGAVSLA